MITTILPTVITVLMVGAAVLTVVAVVLTVVDDLYKQIQRLREASK